ncbi:MBL fold metallo-hydrolase [Shewanella algae]
MSNNVKTKIIPTTHYQQNTCIFWHDDSKKAAIIDPGGEIEKITAFIEQHQLKIEKILLTHGHIDHIGAAKLLADKTSAEILGPHKDDKFLFDMLPDESRLYHFPHCEVFYPDRFLEQGEVIQLGELQLQVIHCPGHTPGHLVFFAPAIKLAWVGDVLFKHSIGRCDFPGGDHAALLDSIKHKLWPLGEEVSFIPGHGPMSTFAEERRHNPYVADR